METKIETINIYEKMAHIQNELKAPKGQYNKFGKYKYRSCEDILEAVKPICLKYRTTLIIYDEIECIAGMNYLKAVCTIYDWDSDNKVEAYAYARESIAKKGMDDSQITGATSSYARKYALNGLFNIDDTKDTDSNELHDQVNTKEPQAQKEQPQLDVTSVMKINASLVCEMDTLGIDFRGKLSNLVFKYSGLRTQDTTKLALEDIYKLNSTYASLIKKFKEQQGANQNGIN